MSQLADLLSESGLSPGLDEHSAAAVASQLQRLAGADSIYPRSIVSSGSAVFFLLPGAAGKHVGCLSAEPPSGLAGERRAVDAGMGLGERTLTLGPASAENLNALRRRLPYLAPRALGLQRTAGGEDRIGLATPAQLRSLRKGLSPAGESRLAPVLARYSPQDASGSGRSAREILDDAAWGVFQEGWREGYGAAAVQLQTADEIDACLAAGYTSFSVDAAGHIDESSIDLDGDELFDAADALPWGLLDDTLDDLIARLAGRAYDLGGSGIMIGQRSVARAAVKYGRAVVHLLQMWRQLQAGSGHRSFDLEFSIEVSERETSIAEHIYLGSEMRRLGIAAASFAPRFTGRNELNVLAGGPSEFVQRFQKHTAVAKTFGPYKLVLHAGPDSLGFGPVAAQVGGELFHLDLAGAGDLESLRTVALKAPGLFRELLQAAQDQAASDKADLPNGKGRSDQQLPSLLDDASVRQALHAAAGALLNESRIRDPLVAILRANEELHDRTLESHFDRHLGPFQ